MRVSLMEYGFAAGCGSIDSVLTKSKRQRQQRHYQELNTAARYKSSLNKVFTDEGLSFARQPHGYTTLDLSDPNNKKIRAYESLDAHRILHPDEVPR